MIAALYRFFLYPLAYSLLQVFRPLWNEKTRQMIRDKNKSFFEIKNKNSSWIASQRPFWIHAASGEIEYARPVIRELKGKYPEIPIIVTYSSPSAKKILKSLAEVDAWGALPWDFQSDCQKFLEHWQPRCWLVARTDVWPVMAEICHKNEIPSLLFSATFASNSSRLKGPSAAVTRWALNRIDEIHCVSDDDVKQLQHLNLQVPVYVHGDTRFDQVFHRLQHPKPLKKELRPPEGAPVLVAGSTWPEDEDVLLSAFSTLKNRCKLILAPHEIHESHLKPLQENLRRLGFSYCKYSNATSWRTEDILLIDEVGILAELYTWGRFAFVGGSFKKQIHSVMEPLAAGLPVLVGPYHQNNREALLFKEKTLAGQVVVTEVHDSATMNSELSKMLKTLSPQFSEVLYQELRQHRNSSGSVVEWCTRHLTRS